jgi:uncharacterized protein involved in exopolysaccharide biosynthesis
MAPAEDEIDLIELFHVVWRGKWVVIAITFIFFAIAVAYALLATSWYRAEVLLIPAEKQSTSGLMAQFGGLAGLAGISVGTDDSAEPIAVLESAGFTRSFIEGESLLSVLLADEWNPVTKSWKESDAVEQPDWRDAVEYFENDVRSVNKDSSTGLVTLAINWTDPGIAADWANKLVKRLNDTMRERALDDANSNVAYLRAEMTTTNIVAVQQAIGRLLESEMQKLMLARGKEEFSLRVIDRAEPPKQPTSPQRLLVVALSTLAGSVFSLLFVIISHAVRKRHHDALRSSRATGQ